MTLEGITNLNQVWVLNRHILVMSFGGFYREVRRVFSKRSFTTVPTLLAVTFPHQTNSTSKPIPLLSPDFLVFLLAVTNTSQCTLPYKWLS